MFSFALFSALQFNNVSMVAYVIFYYVRLLHYAAHGTIPNGDECYTETGCDCMSGNCIFGTCAGAVENSLLCLFCFWLYHGEYKYFSHQFQFTVIEYQVQALLSPEPCVLRAYVPWAAVPRIARNYIMPASICVSGAAPYLTSLFVAVIVLRPSVACWDVWSIWSWTPALFCSLGAQWSSVGGQGMLFESRIG